MKPDRATRARWRREEQADFDKEVEEANRHVDNCLCAAVQPGFVDGPTCFQKGGRTK